MKSNSKKCSLNSRKATCLETERVAIISLSYRMLFFVLSSIEKMILSFKAFILDFKEENVLFVNIIEQVLSLKIQF